MIYLENSISGLDFIFHFDSPFNMRLQISCYVILQQTASLQKLASDKGQTIERHNQEIEQYEFKLQKLVDLVRNLLLTCY